MRLAVSMTRAATLSKRRRMVAIRRCAGGSWPAQLRESPHQPVGSGVEDEPHLVGVGRAAGGPVTFELGLVQLDQILGLAARAIEDVVDMLGAADARDVTTKRISRPRVLASIRATTRRLVLPQLFAAYRVSVYRRSWLSPRIARSVAQLSASVTMTGSACRAALPGSPKT